MSGQRDSFLSDALAFLRSPEPLPDAVTGETDPAVIEARLRSLKLLDDPAWVAGVLEREQWIGHVLARLRSGAIEYENQSFLRPLHELLDELAEEAADGEAWAAIAHHVLDGRDDLEAEVRDLVDQALRDVASAGAYAWARIRQAQVLLAASSEQSSNGWGPQ
jgi:hypothetical protein